MTSFSALKTLNQKKKSVNKKGSFLLNFKQYDLRTLLSEEISYVNDTFYLSDHLLNGMFLQKKKSSRN